MFRIGLLAVLLAIAGCRSTPFKVERLTITEQKKVLPTDDKRLRDLEGVLSDGMAARYKKAKSPSFGLIHGFYRLPSTKPFGEATIVRSYSYNTNFEAVKVKGSERGFAIEPILGDDAVAFNQAINSLLDIGVKIKDISMTDALTIAKAESEAAQKSQSLFLSKVLPPDVDYLMSIYPSVSARGPVLIGRVIKKDGSLVAFRVIYRNASSNLLGGLITSLFEDTISRI